MSMFQNSRPIPLDYSTERNVSLRRFFNQVYSWMAAGLAVTAIVGFLASQVPDIARALAHPGAAVVCALGLFALAWVAQSAAMKISAAAGLALFMLYAGVMGLFLSVIFLVYKMDTLVGAFLITGGVFAGVSVVGMVTKRDLSGIGGIAVMCAFGLFFASIFNVFFASNTLSWVITYAVLAVFIVITAYRTQQLKQLALAGAENQVMLNRLAVVGSMILYISFINLFLSILRILGSRR